MSGKAIAMKSLKEKWLSIVQSADEKGEKGIGGSSIVTMKAYFIINTGTYMDDSTTILIFLNKLSKGRGATFAKGWYMKLANLVIPESEKTFKKLCKAFEEAFVPKDIKD